MLQTAAGRIASGEAFYWLNIRLDPGVHVYRPWADERRRRLDGGIGDAAVGARCRMCQSAIVHTHVMERLLGKLIEETTVVRQS